jgi:CDP-diacylglycerol--glycerol-3-phosphate 3-phosphatidyltransferase
MISYRLARVCVTLRITPNVLTTIGVLSAGVTAWVSPNWWCLIFLAISLIADGIDGSVAIYSGRTSASGAVWDGLADRISEALWALAFYRLGVPLGWVLALASLAAFQEYARARLASLGVSEVGIVTPGERPIRASFLAVAIVSSQINFAKEWPTPIAIILTVVQLVSFVLVLRFAFTSLKKV